MNFEISPLRKPVAYRCYRFLFFLCVLLFYCFIFSAHVNASGLDIAKESRVLAAQGKFQAALDKSLQALDYLSKEKPSKPIVTIYVIDDVASLYYRLGKNALAREYAQKAYKKASLLPPAKKEAVLAHVSRNQAAIEARFGNVSLAEQRYQLAYRFYKNNKSEWKNAIAVGNDLFNVYLELDQLALSETLLEENEKRIALNSSNEFMFDLALNRMKLGIKKNDFDLVENGRYTADNLAKSVSKKKLQKYKEINGRAYIFQSKIPKAESIFLSIIDSQIINNKKNSKTYNDHALAVANANYYLGFIYILQGKVVEAEPVVLEALHLYRKVLSAHHPVVARSLHQLAIINKNIGGFEKSKDYYLNAIKIFTSAYGDEHETVGATRLEYSLLLSYLKQYEEAKAQSNKAITLFKSKADKPLQLGYAYSSLGFAYFYEDDYTKAELPFEKAIGLIENVRGIESADLPPGLIKLAEIALTKKQYAKAKKKINRAIRLLEKMNAESPYGLIKALSVKAKLLSEMGETVRAKELGDTYIAMLQTRLSINRNSIVNLALEEQREVKGLFNQYLDIHVQGYQGAKGFADDLFNVAQYPHMTSTASSINQMATRVSVASKSLTKLLQERDELLIQWKSVQAQNVEGLISSNVEISLDSLDELTEKIKSVDKKINKKFPSFSELTNANTIDIAQVRSSLKDNEGFMLQVSGSNSTTLFYIDHNTVEIKTTALTDKELTKRVNRIRHSLDLTRSDITSYARMPAYEVDDAYYLYQHIFKPFEQEISKKEKLILVLDGAMQNLPPGVLVRRPLEKTTLPLNYRGLDFLGHAFAYAIYPAPSSFVALRSLKAKSKAKKAFLGVGDPDLVQETSTTRSFNFTLDTIAEQIFTYSNPGVLRAIFSPLPETKIELEILAQSFDSKGTTLVLGKDATEERVKALKLHDFQTVSFATHGLLAGEFVGLMEPALVLTPPEKANDKDNGLLMASEIANLSFDADWILLSACNTAGPSGRPGAEGLSGLAKSFFYAGARSLLVSHWSIDSTSAAFISARMMEVNNKDLDKSKLLQQSMIKLAHENKPYFSHPAFWGPFVIVGEG